MKKTYLALMAAMLALAGCGAAESPTPQQQPRVESVSDSQPTSGRYELRAIQSFRDRGAYNGWRTVYELRDVETGVVYIGISGIGISELGSHHAGKSTVNDER